LTAPATSTLAAVAAHGLPSTLEVTTGSFSDDEFHAFISECQEHRLLGLVAAVIRAGGLRITDTQRTEFESRFAGWLAHDIRLEQMLLRALAALADASIRARVFKGVALAHTVYDDPALRVFADVDLLVPSADFGRAVEILGEALGTHRVQPELRPGFDERFGKEAMVRTPSGLELDLHRTFVDGAYGLTVAVDQLFGPPYRFPLGRYELETLAMPARFLQTCYSAALGDWPPRLVSLRDVAQLVLRERPHLVDVLMAAREWQCEVVVARAVTTAWAELGLTERPAIVEWAERYEPSRRERFLLASHLGPARSFTRHAAALVVIPGLTARLAYLRAVALPQPTYLAARHLSPVQHATRAVKRTLRRR
jgi:hypothetical protein